MLIQNWGWIVSFNIPLLNLQVMEFLLAVNDLIEKKYPPDTVEVALIYNNNEKAKVLKVYSLHSVFFTSITGEQRYCVNSLYQLRKD